MWHHTGTTHCRGLSGKGGAGEETVVKMSHVSVQRAVRRRQTVTDWVAFTQRETLVVAVTFTMEKTEHESEINEGELQASTHALK